MNTRRALAELMELPANERLKLAQQLWDSVLNDEGWAPTPDQVVEAKRRLEEHRRNPEIAVPASLVLERLQSRFG